MTARRLAPLPAELRPATPPAACAVAELLLASRRALLPDVPLAHPPADVHRWVAERLIPSGGVHLAVLGERIVGVLATAARGGVGWIDQLYVLPGYEGRGVGSQLLRHAHATLPAPIRLHCFQANVGARRFYERHGYVALCFTDGSGNAERCPDVLYERTSSPRHAIA